MHKFLKRQIESTVKEYFSVFPAVVILGPRQCGKSTLVKMMVEHTENMLFLDLQNMDDLNKLNEPMLYFELNKEKVICLDEIQLNVDARICNPKHY